MPSDSVMLVAGLGGELITYTPYGEEAKTVKAIVNRRPNQVQPNVANAGKFSYHAHAIELQIPRDETDGILAIVEGQDKVSFKRQLDDEDDTEFTVTKIVQEDAGIVPSDGGMFTLLVQA